MISRLPTFARKSAPKPAPIQTISKPESLIIKPVEAATVTRLANGRFLIKWQENTENVRIYVSAKPVLNGDAQIWADVTGAQAVVVPPVPHTSRPYFILDFGEDKRMMTAERFLPVPNSLNFRDAGGYEGDNGRSVRWGQVYRSGTIAHLDATDFAALDTLTLHMVVDLRSSHESQNAPDRLPHNPACQHLLRPLSSAGTRSEQIRTLHQYRHRTSDLLLRMYQESFIDQNAHHIGDVLTRLAAPANRPALLHCSAGKDRTGITIALLLAVLGVPEATIVADYSLSNLAYARIVEVMAPDLRQARWAAVRYAQMEPVLLADPAHLQATFAYIRSKYGSIERYLCGAAGMAPETLDTLRQELLV